MSLSKTYLDEHANNARGRRGRDGANYEVFGRAVAELLMREAARAEPLKAGEAEKIELSGITATLTQNKANVCVTITVCAPMIGSITAHVGG
jgi:hypothetical protein